MFLATLVSKEIVEFQAILLSQAIVVSLAIVGSHGIELPQLNVVSRQF